MENSIIPKKDFMRYYKRIRRALLCKRKLKNKFLGDLKNSVSLYLAENSTADIAELTAHFGSPEEIAENFAADMGIDYRRQLKRRRIVTAVLLGMVAVIMVFTVIMGILIIQNHNQQAVLYYDITLTDDTENGEK